jgi:uncharacterized tellurite resistance protein B-like protein
MIHKEFNLEQKAAILTIMIIMAKADGKVVEKEISYIDLIARKLDISQFDPTFQKMAYFRKADLMMILNTLSIRQKEWLIILIQSMVMIDGVAQEMEINFALGIAKDLGISEIQYLKINQDKILLNNIKSFIQ